MLSSFWLFLFALSVVSSCIFRIYIDIIKYELVDNNFFLQINQIRINPLNCEKLNIEILAWNSFRSVCVWVNFMKKNERKSTTSYVIEKYFLIKSMKKNDQILLFHKFFFRKNFTKMKAKSKFFVFMDLWFGTVIWI